MRRRARAARPLRFRYGDPPYPGLARRYYGDEPEFDGEVDHVALLARLQEADAWALSTSAEALPWLLSHLEVRGGTTPPRLFDARGRRVRIAVWKRGARPGVSHRPRRAWEPVLYSGGRQERRDDWTPDVLDHHARPRRTERRRLVGAKPGEFWWWLFELVGLRPGDTFEDLFGGTGAGSRAWSMLESAQRSDSDDTSRTPGDDASPIHADDTC